MARDGMLRRTTIQTRRRLVLAIGAVLVMLLTPGVAQAHAAMVSSEPKPGQTLGTAPGVVIMRFSEPLNTKLSRATVTDPSGQRFNGTASSDEQIRVPLATNATGIYTVGWTTVSVVDGHTLRGSFQFGVGVSPGTASSEGTASTNPGGSDLLIAVARTVEYAALLLAFGMLLLRRLARKRPELVWLRVRHAPVLALALISGAVVILSEASSAAGSLSPGGVWSYLSTGLPGLARLSRLGLEALALVAALLGASALWLFLTAATVALAASGHAAGINPEWWGITVDAAHLAAAGIWAGGIMALATVRPPGGWRGPAARALLEAFSPVGLAAFLITVGFGIVQAFQEVGSVHELVGSSYGRVLLVKLGLVALMVPLSAIAWRSRHAAPRLEGTLAILVIAAAGLLAAFPVPPSRLERAEAARQVTPSRAALPRAGELTMGGHAGQVLVGLTLHPGTPGHNDVSVYLLPIEGNKAAGNLRAELVLSGRPIRLEKCGDTCRDTAVNLRGGEDLVVHVEGPKGGTAEFQLPALPAPDGTGLVDLMQRRMHQLRTYRLEETLSSGLATIHATYAFQAPDKMESVVAGESRSVLIGGTRYLQEKSGGPWQVQPGGPPLQVPSFIWDYFRPFVDPRIVGSATIDGVRTQIVSFSGGSGGVPIWFRVWIDPDGLVRRAEMRAPGHFMDHRYFDFDGSITISPPVG
jgi:copper transport protein